MQAGDVPHDLARLQDAVDVAHGPRSCYTRAA
jgi:hypothetical protein